MPSINMKNSSQYLFSDRTKKHNTTNTFQQKLQIWQDMDQEAHRTSLGKPEKKMGRNCEGSCSQFEAKTSRRPLKGIENVYHRGGSVHSSLHKSQFTAQGTKARYILPSQKRTFSIFESPVKRQSPNDLFIERLVTVKNRYPEGTDYLTIRAAIEPADPDWVPHLNLTTMTISENQIRRIRVLVLPPDRMQTMDTIGKFLLGFEFYCRPRIFGPDFAVSVIQRFRVFLRLYATEGTTPPKRLNMLVSVTYHLHVADHWMTDHPLGWGGEKMIAKLARRWKELLKEASPSGLNLDLEYSYPAIQYLLQSFKEKVEGSPTGGDPPMLFNYN